MIFSGGFKSEKSWDGDKKQLSFYFDQMKCVDMNTLEEILKVCRPQHHWNYQKEFGRDDRSLKKGHFYHGVFYVLIFLCRQTFLSEFRCDPIPVFSVPVERKKPVHLSILEWSTRDHHDPRTSTLT